MDCKLIALLMMGILLFFTFGMSKPQRNGCQKECVPCIVNFCMCLSISLMPGTIAKWIICSWILAWQWKLNCFQHRSLFTEQFLQFLIFLCVWFKRKIQATWQRESAGDSEGSAQESWQISCFDCCFLLQTETFFHVVSQYQQHNMGWIQEEGRREKKAHKNSSINSSLSNQPLSWLQLWNEWQQCGWTIAVGLSFYDIPTKYWMVVGVVALGDGSLAY